MRMTYLLMAAALGLTGCGGDDDGPVVVYPVSGQVIYDGKPAVGVRVTFFPTEAPTRPRIPQNPSGVTDKDGRFKLTTYLPDDGAAAGSYKVLISSDSSHDVNDVGSERSQDEDMFRGWYDVAHSPLTATVTAEKSNDQPAYKIPKISRAAGEAEGVPGRN